mgnify:CR=1 FL=1
MDIQTLFNLNGRVALVTGGSRGIGKMIVEGYLKAGAARVYISARKVDQIEETVAEFGNQVIGLPCDLSTVDGCLSLAAQIAEREEKVDILVNNAGVALIDRLEDAKVADWDATMAVNLRAPFLLAREIVPGMIERKGGKIINMGSLTSQAARPTIAPYTVAKGGIKMLSRAMAAEWAQFNIQANSIGPGYIMTDMNKLLMENAQFDTWVKSSNPAQRWGKPEELVGTAIYLASEASNYVNGQIIYVDGGWLSVL